MAHEDKPLDYERRIQDTKGLAQRIELAYLGQAGRLNLMRRRAAWVVVLVSIAALIPYFLKGRQRFYENGRVSQAHAVFETNCAACHNQAFTNVSDASCKACHDGPLHQVNAIGVVGCAQCHIEHLGKMALADVDDRHCTRCHSDLRSHGNNLRIHAVSVTGFGSGRHPEFSAANRHDDRPLRLNHAKHMPAVPNTVRGKKLPMKCSDCHATDLQSPIGDLVPVTFEKNCRSCHDIELQFDVFQLLGEGAPPAPHTKNPATIHDAIVNAYRTLSSSDPAVVRKPLRIDEPPLPNADAWLERVVTESEGYLFQKNKCTYCHEYAGFEGGYPVVKKVNQIHGLYVPDNPAGQPWTQHARFSHRSHRAVQCSSCHQEALRSTKTSDVLIPKMRSCLPCHGATGTRQDRCATCHLYHDKTKELERDRRPVEQLTSTGAAAGG